MNKRQVQWLYEELPGLVGQGVLPADAAERLRQHYGEPEAAGSTAKRWAISLFSILGVTLIGGGIILLLAHNWEEFPRPVRTGLSLLPMLVAQGLAGYGVLRERASTAWREVVGLLWAAGIGTSIGLVALTYHLSGDIGEFWLVWTLAGLPVAYLLGATVPALLYLVGITVWTGSVLNCVAKEPLWYFPLLALALPYWWQTSRANRYHLRPVLFAWVLAITVCIATGLALARAIDRLEVWPVLFGGLFGLLFLVGARWWGTTTSAWRQPLQSVGVLGVLGLSLVLTFGDAWSHGRWHWEPVQTWRAAAEVAVVAVILVAALALWVRSWTRRGWHEMMVGAVPALATIGWVLDAKTKGLLGAGLFNLYLFGFGIGTLVIGLRRRRLATVNAGMAVFTVVILCRFADADLGFVLRGVAFIVIGLGFLVTNLVLLRQKGAAR